MAIWSSLRSLVSNSSRNAIVRSDFFKRNMGGHHNEFPYQPSRFQWTKFKDLAHFYIFMGVIPLAALTTLINVFTGPATLAEIPADYEPKHWEYHRHPITRFIARYLMNNPQQEYEKYMHFVYEEDEKARLRKLERDVKAKMAERNDYQAYYYKPIVAKYYRVTREAADYIESVRGD